MLFRSLGQIALKIGRGEQFKDALGEASGCGARGCIVCVNASAKKALGTITFQRYLRSAQYGHQIALLRAQSPHVWGCLLQQVDDVEDDLQGFRTYTGHSFRESYLVMLGNNISPKV